MTFRKILRSICKWLCKMLWLLCKWLFKLLGKLLLFSLWAFCELTAATFAAIAKFLKEKITAKK